MLHAVQEGVNGMINEEIKYRLDNAEETEKEEEDDDEEEEEEEEKEEEVV